MSVSRYPQITEELLSAYLDNSVSEEDRRLIEHAISVEPQLAWQLESLRQTVQLLQSLPAVALPRAFTLDRVMLEQKLAAEQAQNARHRVVQQAPVGLTWWQRWLTLWQGGSPYLRNGAMIAILLCVVLVAGNQLFSVKPTGSAQLAAVPASAVAIAPAPAEIAAVTQSIEPQDAAEQSRTAAGTTAPSEGPILAGAVGKDVVTAAPPPATTAIASMAVQSAGARNGSVNGSALTTANQSSAVTMNDAPAGDAPMTTGPMMPMAGARTPGDDTQVLDPLAGDTGIQTYGATEPNQPTTQEHAAAVEAELPTNTPLPADNQPAAATELAQSSDMVVAASVLTETTVVDPVATPTVTATATVTPTSTITATATMTTTVTPTVTEISQGPLPPEVEVMQVGGNPMTMLQSLFTQLTVTIILSLSLLWWRRQTV